jgi:dihydrofolate synthase/folylpolyglutamate synthase
LLEQLGPDRIDLLIACEPASPRAVDAAEVATAARALGIETIVEPDARSATEAARSLAAEDDLIVVTGSLYVVGAVRGLFG